MEQPKADEVVLPSEKLSMDSPPNLVHPEMYADPHFPKLKSKILQKWVASTKLPKLEPVELVASGATAAVAPSGALTPPESTLSDGATPSQSESKSPPLTTPLSVDTTFTTPPKDSTSYYQCRACNALHRQSASYPDRRPVMPESEDPHWICCDHCLNWFHCECVDLEPYETFLIDVFACKACEPEKGLSKLKKTVAPHRNKFDAADEVDKPMEVGTKPWIDAFVSDEATKYKPPPSDSLVKVLEIGHEFEGEFQREQEWKNVYLIKNKAGLGIQMPEPGEMYIDELVEILGAKRLVETIDVYRQASVLMSVGRYRELLQSGDRSRLFNILSLEFTGTKLAELVRPPSMVKELSWAERYWPDRTFGPPDTLRSGAEEACDSVHQGLRPDVELFCLMGMGGSFTDFHIDFGGSSVWYHVYKGMKIFYIVEPTAEHLDMYQKHQVRSERETFLGDAYGDKCWRVVIAEGQTLMIPAGWIHAVYTPVDSLVFGGNFLHNLNVEMQCEVNSHENRCLFESRYLYPNFEVINWYAARTFTELLREHNDDAALPRPHVIRGARALVDALAEWLERDRNSADKTTQQGPSRPFIHGESQQAIYNALAKEFKLIEKRLGASASAELRAGDRMSRIIEMRSSDSASPLGTEESSGPRVRISIAVPEVNTSEQLGPLRLRIPRIKDPAAAAGTAAEAAAVANTPATPKLRIRFGDDASALPSVVTEEERRSIGGIDMVSMFSSRSKSGRQKKPAAWLKEALGEEIEREKEEEEYVSPSPAAASAAEPSDRPAAAAKGGRKKKASFIDDDDADYEALERAERGGAAVAKGGVKKAAVKRKAEKPAEKASSSSTSAVPPPAKERKKSSLATSKQRLADKMKNLKRH